MLQPRLPTGVTSRVVGRTLLKSSGRNISGQTATRLGAGDAGISVNWDALNVDRECTAFASDGECVDAICPTNAAATPEGDTQANVAPVSYKYVAGDMDLLVSRGVLALSLMRHWI